jgi:hypothetical protein
VKRQLWITAILLAILLVLAAIVFLVEFRRPEEEPEPLLDTPASRISQITVDAEDGTTYRYIRDEVSTWYMTEPFSSEVEQLLVENAARYLAELSPYRHFTPEEIDLEEFGLLNPSTTITLITLAGDEHALQVGATNSRLRASYILWGEEVYLVSWDLVYDIVRITTMPPLPEGTPLPDGS